MKKSVVLSIFAIFTLYTYASEFTVSKHRTDSLLLVLDKVIKEKDTYTERKNNLIADLRRQVQMATSDNVRFFIYAQLFEEYKNFQMDSALIVANKRMEIADKLNSEAYTFFAEMNIAEVMIVTGMYKEALDILNRQDRNKFEFEQQFATLYHLYHSLYMVMAQYSFLDKEKEKYYNLEYLYKDSILSVLPPEHTGYKIVKTSKLIMEQQYDEAYELAKEIFRENEDDNHLVAMLMHNVTDIYMAQNLPEERQYFLILSAINDIKSGVKEYMSLPELATIIYNEGDINRAYAYMKCSLEDAIFCQARLRTLQMSQTLPIINAAYEVKMKQERNRLIVVVIIVIVLVVGLVVALIYIYKKLKELALARKSLRKINQELKEVNQYLNTLNIELSESNHIKEEYIGYVFNICSIYIDKLDEFRKKVNRKIKGGQIEDLQQQTSTASLVNDELKEFYKSFDSVFLNLYPDFVKGFNLLLQDNEQIILKEGELLTPEMRIYALVRLGINDSVKIASFLHYSPQTVYNYRLKVRNKAKMSKEDFYIAVRELGRPKK